MSNYCTFHRLPQAGVDPIDSPEVALAMIGFMMGDPMRSETLVLLLDEQHRGIQVTVVNGTVPFDAVFDVVELIEETAFTADFDFDAVVIATVRPPERGVPDLDDRDVDRWLEANALLDDAGIDLLEWFVIGHGVACPRDLLGEPARWRRSAA